MEKAEFDRQCDVAIAELDVAMRAYGDAMKAVNNGGRDTNGLALISTDLGLHEALQAASDRRDRALREMERLRALI